MRRIAAAVAFLACCASGATEILHTIVGGGSVAGYDPLRANFSFAGTPGLTISPLGELYFSDTGHNQVLKINPSTGGITLVAGDGSRSYFGDGKLATSAGLNAPGGLALDGLGNLFIADNGNHVVRRVDSVSGNITTVAGNGYTTGQNVNSVIQLLGDNGPATAATFSNEIGDVVVDGSGNVIVADSNNHIIRRFSPGGTITTIAGVAEDSGFSGDGVVGEATSAHFNTPVGLAIDGMGNIMISDSENHRVRRLDSTATLNTVAGSGGNDNAFTGDGTAATTAQIGTLAGMSFDGAGNLLFACVGPKRIRKINAVASTPIITTIFGDGGRANGDGGPATGANLNNPCDVAVDGSGNIYVYDSGDHRIRRLDAVTGLVTTVAGGNLLGFIGDRGSKQNAVLSAPTGAAYDAAGRMYIADTSHNAIRKVAPNGTITTFAGNGVTTGLGDGGKASQASLNAPQDVAVFGNTLFIADNANDRIRAVDLTTEIITTYVAISGPVGLIVDATGVLYVSHDNQIDKVGTDKSVTVYVGNNPTNPNLGDGLPAAQAKLNKPAGMALGANGELYIADTNNNRIRLISAPPESLTSTVAGGGNGSDGGLATDAQLARPAGVALDLPHNRFVFTDTNNERIRAVDLTSRVITTVGGNALPGFSGEGDIGTNAQVNSPQRIFLHDGGLVFADKNNNRIRRLVTAIDIDPNVLSVAVKLSYALDKKTGATALGKDSLALKAALALPAGISAANLPISVDILDVHQQFKLDANGKLPKLTKAAAKAKASLWDASFPVPPPALASTVALGLKGTSAIGGKPASFAFLAKGTLRDFVGRAGFANIDTDKAGVSFPVRVNITIGPATFTGVTNVLYKATQGKSGAGSTSR